MKEVFYVWRQKVSEMGKTRLIVPHSDPFKHEHPMELVMDLIFERPGEAYQALHDYGIVDMYYDGDEEPPEDWKPRGWYLCRQTTEIVG